jgi:hypothetical protein
MNLKQTETSVFFFYKIRELEGRTDPVYWYQWEQGECGERAWEGEYSANTVYTCVNGEMRPAENMPGMMAEGIKENDGEGEFKYDKF